MCMNFLQHICFVSICFVSIYCKYLLKINRLPHYHKWTEIDHINLAFLNTDFIQLNELGHFSPILVVLRDDVFIRKILSLNAFEWCFTWVMSHDHFQSLWYEMVILTTHNEKCNRNRHHGDKISILCHFWVIQIRTLRIF